MGDRARPRLAWAFACMTACWFALSYDLPVGIAEPLHSTLISIIYDGWSLAVTALALVWILRHPRARVWLALVLALAAMTMGDFLWDLSAHRVIPVPNDTPSLMDLFYLPAYLAWGVNVVLLVRRYHPRGLGAWLETLVVAGGTASAAFPLLINPYAETIGSGSLFSRAMNLLYPVSDVMLFAAMVVVLFAAPQVRALREVGAAAGFCMVADYMYASQEAAGTYSGQGWLDWMWLVQYTLMAATVLGPMPRAEPEASANGVVRRTMLLIGATLICPALLVFVRFGMPLGAREQAEAVYAVATLILIALVSARLVGLLRENGATVRHLRSALAEREQLSFDLDHQATHDDLTGLPNRRLLTTEATATVRSVQTSHALVFIDLDDFTAVNDSFGPSEGDAFLRAIAERLSAVVRPGDLVARLGGDEFGVLLPGRGKEEAMSAARRLIDVIATPVDLDGRTLTMGASAGLAILAPKPASAADAVLEGMVRADVAMYAAKRAGGNQVLHYTEQMREQVIGDAALAADLVQAISAAELEVHYQPIVDLGSGRVTAIEALVRWDHPERGRLSPDTFLAIAQLRGVIADLDLLVIETALRQLATWRRKKPGLRLAVNASAQLLARENMVEILLGALTEHHLPGSALIIEVTEQTVIDDFGRAARCLERLRDHGVSIALDDFGTGYSSLSYLQQLPVDVLKLDQSFIRRGITAAGLSPLLRAVIELGHELGVAVVAEGIETQAQLLALERAGCERGQGWLFARALPAEQVPGYLELVLPGTRPVRAGQEPERLTSSGA